MLGFYSTPAYGHSHPKCYFVKLGVGTSDAKSLLAHTTPKDPTIGHM
jgi:hypothetical protein